MTAQPARLMSTADLAEYLGKSTRTIERWRAAGEGPAYLLVGHSIRYHPTRVAQWLAAQERRGGGRR